MLLSRSNLYLSNTGCVFREVSSLCRYFVSLTFKVCLEKFKSVFAYVRRVGDNRLTELHHDRYMYAYTLRSALSVFPLARLPLIFSHFCPPRHWQFTSERGPVCGRDRGSIVPVCHQTLTNISAILAASHWAAAVCLAYIGDLTASYWCEVCVRVHACV